MLAHNKSGGGGRGDHWGGGGGEWSGGRPHCQEHTSRTAMAWRPTAKRSWRPQPAMTPPPPWGPGAGRGGGRLPCPPVIPHMGPSPDLRDPAGGVYVSGRCCEEKTPIHIWFSPTPKKPWVLQHGTEEGGGIRKWWCGWEEKEQTGAILLDTPIFNASMQL